MWAVAVAQILLVVTDPGGLRERLGPVLLAVSLNGLLLLAAAARWITHPIKPAPTAKAGWTDAPPHAAVSAIAQGGPCDGMCWQLEPDQFPAPQQIWLPANGASHCYRLALRQLGDAPTCTGKLTYHHRP